MSSIEIVKNLIKANALFGPEKIKSHGLRDGANLLTESMTFEDADNSITLTSSIPDWATVGSYFRVTGAGANDGNLFKVGSISGLKITNDDSEVEVSAVVDFTGSATLDARKWKVINDLAIASESGIGSHTIFNLSNDTVSGLADGSGLAAIFSDHYHTQSPGSGSCIGLTLTRNSFGSVITIAYTDGSVKSINRDVANVIESIDYLGWRKNLVRAGDGKISSITISATP